MSPQGRSEHALRRMNFPRRIVAPHDGVGGVILSHVCLPLSLPSRLRTALGWVFSGHGTKRPEWWCAACGQYDWKALNRVLVMQDSTDHREATVFRAHAAPHGVCDNLINADSPVKMVVQSPRWITKRLWKRRHANGGRAGTSKRKRGRGEREERRRKKEEGEEQKEEILILLSPSTFARTGTCCLRAWKLLTPTTCGT